MNDMLIVKLIELSVKVLLVCLSFLIAGVAISLSWNYTVSDMSGYNYEMRIIDGAALRAFFQFTIASTKK